MNELNKGANIDISDSSEAYQMAMAYLSLYLPISYKSRNLTVKGGVPMCIYDLLCELHYNDIYITTKQLRNVIEILKKKKI